MRTETAPRPSNTAGTPLDGRLKAYGLHHLRSLMFSLGKLSRSPLASGMTIAVIAIALALPACLYTLLGNMRVVGEGWDVSSSRISLYLKPGVSEAEIERLSQRLRSQESIAEIQHITPDEGLEQFRSLSGFGSALDALDSNPLPHVITLLPGMVVRDPQRLATLAESLEKLDTVDRAQIDLQWVQRLHALVGVLDRGVAVLGGLLSLAVLLIVGNTIRLDILSRREEIEVTKLIGATDAFIRRPFLYGGVWYGVFGGLLALALVGLTVALLSAPAERLALSYGSRFDLSGLSLGDSTLLVLGASLLGWLGSWLAVGRHLERIEPR